MIMLIIETHNKFIIYLSYTGQLNIQLFMLVDILVYIKRCKAKTPYMF